MPLLDAIPRIRGLRGRPRHRPRRLFADRGYDFDKYRRLVRARGITPKIARRGTPHGSGLGKTRWVVERTLVDRGKQGLKRSGMTDGYGIPLGRVLAGANHHDSPLLTPTLDRLESLGPLPDTITVHLDAGYDSDTTRALLSKRGLHGRIAHKGEKAPIQASRRWHVERTHAWQNAFHRLARCYERRVTVIEAFFDLADTIITVRSLIRRSWTTHRWDERPNRRP